MVIISFYCGAWFFLSINATTLMRRGLQHRRGSWRSPRSRRGRPGSCIGLHLDFHPCSGASTYITFLRYKTWISQGSKNWPNLKQSASEQEEKDSIKHSGALLFHVKGEMLFYLCVLHLRQRNSNLVELIWQTGERWCRKRSDRGDRCGVFGGQAITEQWTTTTSRQTHLCILMWRNTIKMFRSRYWPLMKVPICIILNLNGRSETKLYVSLQSWHWKSLMRAVKEHFRAKNKMLHNIHFGHSCRQNYSCLSLFLHKSRNDGSSSNSFVVFCIS